MSRLRRPANILFIAVDFLCSAYAALWLSSWLMEWFFSQEGRIMPEGQQHTLVLMAVWLPIFLVLYSLIAVLWARLRFGGQKKD
ncbi:MAG: hypothetical protein ACPG31_00790 [Planctomycetota bacterium]